MSWTNKAVLAWGWILTPEEIATLPEEVYEEWLDNEWLIYSEGMDEEIFTYFSVDADESPKNVTDVTELVSEIGNEEIAKRVVPRNGYIHVGQRRRYKSGSGKINNSSFIRQIHQIIHCHSTSHFYG